MKSIEKEAEYWAEKTLSEVEYFIKYGKDKPIKVGYEEFYRESLNRMFMFDRVETQNENGKQTLIIKTIVSGEFFD